MSTIWRDTGLLVMVEVGASLPQPPLVVVRTGRPQPLAATLMLSVFLYSLLSQPAHLSEETHRLIQTVIWRFVDPSERSSVRYFPCNLGYFRPRHRHQPSKVHLSRNIPRDRVRG